MAHVVNSPDRLSIPVAGTEDTFPRSSHILRWT